MPTVPPTKGPGPAKPGGSSGYTGRVVARCRVGEKLGRGATSHVFRALYEPLNKDIALKILGKESAGSSDLRTRFLSEARAVAKINHENIVKVIDVVEDQGLLCILMELVAGPTLQDRLDDEDVIPPRQAFRIAAQIARALEAAHAEKIVHRDVKPANVMLVGPAGDETVKVVDFGLAVQQEMNRVGTPLFMSPEAAQGKRIDEKSDVYALGICLYRMLTGVLPFTGATVKEILAAQVNAELVPPSEQRPQLGKSYDDLLKKLLVKSKGYRPSAGEAAETLEEIADDLEEREMGVRRARRRKKGIGPKKSKAPGPGLWAGLAVAALVAVGLYYAFSRSDKPSGAAEAPNAGAVKTPPAAPVVVDPAETAFGEVEAWIKENPTDRRGEIVKWKDYLKAFPKPSKWTTQAAARQKRAEELFGGKIDERPPAPTARPASSGPKGGSEPPATKYARLDGYVKSFDFAAASSLLNDGDGLDPPAGTETKDWEFKGRRCNYLGKNLISTMDAGLRATKRRPKAKDLFPDAKDGEILVGANHEGGVVAAADGTGEHTLKWSTATADAFFKKSGLVDTALDTGTFDGNALLAALAAELGQTPKIVTKFRDQAIGVAGSDDAKTEQVKSLVGGD